MLRTAFTCTLFLCFYHAAKSQDLAYYEAAQVHYEASEDSSSLLALREAYGKQKVYPAEMELEILIALAHYPELKDTRIHFMFREQDVAHSTSPLVGTLFSKKSKRVYMVYISTKVPTDLEGSLSSSMNYNARIGVMAHELAHISWYEQQNAFQLMGAAIGYLFPAYRRNMERATDYSVIGHNLAHQLWAWSTAVHEIHIADGRGDLYLSPEEIESQILK